MLREFDESTENFVSAVIAALEKHKKVEEIKDLRRYVLQRNVEANIEKYAMMSQTLPQSTAEFSELYSAFVKKELFSSKKGSDVRKEIVQQTIEGRLAAFLVIRKCRKVRY
ncbi:hypothetical protein L5515_019091 [Caenorhabditis briggsae]|uniref:Uncharacterized protein n=1 Tax=Caenorhabditis briggsae TaxID=6238 RepID=A0AAE9FL69_CAEBR|nr:hypothetical protein L5515_019091 [Caenorhabditis briggsae]